MKGFGTTNALISEIEGIVEKFGKEQAEVGATLHEILVDMAVDFFAFAEQCDEAAWAILAEAWEKADEIERRRAEG